MTFHGNRPYAHECIKHAYMPLYYTQVHVRTCRCTNVFVYLPTNVLRRLGVIYFVVFHQPFLSYFNMHEFNFTAEKF